MRGLGDFLPSACLVASWPAGEDTWAPWLGGKELEDQRKERHLVLCEGLPGQVRLKGGWGRGYWWNRDGFPVLGLKVTRKSWNLPVIPRQEGGIQ